MGENGHNDELPKDSDDILYPLIFHGEDITLGDLIKSLECYKGSPVFSLYSGVNLLPIYKRPFQTLTFVDGICHAAPFVHPYADLRIDRAVEKCEQDEEIRVKANRQRLIKRKETNRANNLSAPKKAWRVGQEIHFQASCVDGADLFVQWSPINPPRQVEEVNQQQVAAAIGEDNEMEVEQRGEEEGNNKKKTSTNVNDKSQQQEGRPINFEEMSEEEQMAYALRMSVEHVESQQPSRSRSPSTMATPAPTPMETEEDGNGGSGGNGGQKLAGAGVVGDLLNDPACLQQGEGGTSSEDQKKDNNKNKEQDEKKND